MQIPEPHKKISNLNIRVSKSFGSSLIAAATRRGEPYSTLARKWLIAGAKAEGVELHTDIQDRPVQAV